MNRMITVHTSLDDTPFLFQSLTGKEALSSLYTFHVDVLCEAQPVDPKKLLGQTLTVGCYQTPQCPPRYLSGIMTRVEVKGRDINDRYDRYTLTVKPALWYLGQGRDCRIWQEKSVPDIITTLLREQDIAFENRLSWDYRCWEYCVQYQESDFDFISRLMEHEGIYYYFLHDNGKHTLVLADAPEQHEVLSGFATFPCIDETASDVSESGIAHWRGSETMSASLYLTDDYDFRRPCANLLQARQNPAPDGQQEAVVFDWPGRYTRHDDGAFYGRIRQQELACAQAQMSGETPSLGMAPGHAFTLTRATRPEDNRTYIVSGAEYFFSEAGYYSQDDEEATPVHRTVFTAHPAALSWRPARQTAWPRTYGPQTAEVVGPQGQTIWTDEYGRVKLKFRWDRHNPPGNDQAACWVRVSSAWAGWGYGSIQVPRVGEEVIVDFINGDPDRPIVTGRVYNQDSMPPWDLPADATKMGFMTRSAGGTPENGSFLVFDDAPGRETFDMHAERDMSMSTERDLTVNIEGARTTRVKGEDRYTFDDSQRVRIAKGRQVDIAAGGDNREVTGDSTTTLHGKQTVIIDGELVEEYRDGQTTTVTAGGQTLKIHAGGQTIIISEGGRSIDIVGDAKKKITGSEREDTTGEWTKSVAGTINILSDADVNIKSATKITLDAPNQKATTGKGHSESFTGHSFSMTGASESFTGSSVSFTNSSVSFTASSVSMGMFSISNTPFKLSKHDNHLEFVSGNKTLTSTLLSLKSDYSAFVSALTTIA
ncbi:type VI secretion system Vgr family protein [Serratia marcescens]|uniref:type VI secretion system Vgr family protein n=1 Tax=Serratia marcescens TaxID=615 RepID=UPI000F803FCF|nr:type VI secretion system tip protein TssI/VgrG [Serratia marcescens]RTF03041.1 type VI secretion system tip protein VgrG [Serratia marcescens]